MSETVHPFLDGKPKRLLIGGQWVEALSGRTFDSVNPATGKVIAQLAEGGEEDIDRAVAAARARQDYDAVVEGVELVRRGLGQVLYGFGLEHLAVAAGDPFDGFLHQTLTGLDAIHEGATIVAELRPGYRRGNQVLRRAIVRVAEEVDA